MGVTSEFGPAPADLEPPRGKTSVGRRHAIQYREQIQEGLRASRRCSDCVHFGEDDHRVGPVPYCDLNRWPAGSLRECFRTAASCDDYEEVDDGEGGVEG